MTTSEGNPVPPSSSTPQRSSSGLPRRALLLAPAAVGLAAALASCTSDGAPAGTGAGSGSGATSGSGTSDDGLLAARGWTDQTAREIIEELEALPLDERPADLTASVQQEELVLADTAGREAVLPLVEDDFRLSIAPYVVDTHDCFLHSLTTCVGELQSEDLQVLVTSADGEVLIDEVRTTAANGFLGLWLPRDEQLSVSLARDGESARAEVTTDAESATCLTTMRLEA